VKNEEQAIANAETIFDKEWGAEKEANREIARRGLSLLPADMQKTIKKTGLVNDPAIVRYLYGIGKGNSEDRIANGQTVNGGEKSAARVLYPSMYPNKE